MFSSDYWLSKGQHVRLPQSFILSYYFMCILGVYFLLNVGMKFVGILNSKFWAYCMLKVWKFYGREDSCRNTIHLSCIKILCTQRKTKMLKPVLVYWIQLNFAGMLTDIVARWPGSTHNSHICRTSAVGGNLEGTGGVLHGNGGYACSPFLVTLYLNPKTPQEEHST